MKRRSFVISTPALFVSASGAAAAANRRVAVIGHTGRGNFGHGLDTVWLKVPNAQIVGVSDGNPDGLAAELRRLKVEKGYVDYRKMLAEVRPEFVSVCPRHADQHKEMLLAAIEAGVKGIYVEKPICRTPAEADEISAAATRHGTRIAVAHRNRYHPTLKVIERMIADGAIGQLLEIRGRGKGDRRGGGEDLWVLGSHVMNLIHYFAGKPVSCSAVMLQNKKPVTVSDVIDGAEGLGPLAGDEVHARYETSRGIIAFYDSIANDGTAGAAYCMELIGSTGKITIHIDRDPLAHLIPGTPWKVGQSKEWIPITTGGPGTAETNPDLITGVHNHLAAVTDLVAVCDSNRDPLCPLSEGAVTVEMICGVFASHQQGGRSVTLPLQERTNALQHLK